MATRTHQAVCTVAARAPLEIRYVTTVPPGEGEVLVRNEWTASTPLDLHQADGGLLVNHPQVLGDGVAGTVVEVGPGVKDLAIGDKVFGFTWRTQQEKAHQEMVTAPEYLLGKVSSPSRIQLQPLEEIAPKAKSTQVPKSFSLEESVVIPNNFVTVFNACSKDLGLTLPWPKPDGYVPSNADDVILIWGGSSSVGQYAIQILRYFGYKNLLATASKKHHEALIHMGASQCFDYNDASVTSSIIQAAGSHQSSRVLNPMVSFILDCIGSVDYSVKPVSQIAAPGSRIAIMLPLILKDSSEAEAPEYAMDVHSVANWTDGAEPCGVRTHFYLDNEFFKDHLQSEIMPYMLAKGIVKPNKQLIVEGSTLLERAQKALNMLRLKQVSGERLVWRVAS